MSNAILHETVGRISVTLLANEIVELPERNNYGSLIQVVKNGYAATATIATTPYSCVMLNVFNGDPAFPIVINDASLNGFVFYKKDFKLYLKNNTPYSDSVNVVVV